MKEFRIYFKGRRKEIETDLYPLRQQVVAAENECHAKEKIKEIFTVKQFLHEDY